MSTRPDEGVISKVATYIGCDHFSIDPLATYEELGLACAARSTTLLSRRGAAFLAASICHVEKRYVC